MTSEPLRERFKYAESERVASEPDNKAQPRTRKQKPKKHWLYVVAIVVIVAILAGVGFFIFSSRTKSPIPKSVRQAVSFSIYYPDPKKLPAGYTLDVSSFSNPVKNGALYRVNYGNNQKIVFSLQPKPNDNELEAFTANYMPLKTTYRTPVGDAQIGAYNQKAFVSLPTDHGPWIVITAPGDINQDQLKQVLRAIKP